MHNEAARLFVSLKQCLISAETSVLRCAEMSCHTLPTAPSEGCSQSMEYTLCENTQDMLKQPLEVTGVQEEDSRCARHPVAKHQSVWAKLLSKCVFLDDSCTQAVALVLYYLVQRVYEQREPTHLLHSPLCIPLYPSVRSW